MKYKSAMIFGVFDGLHPGHKHLLLQAWKRTDKLIVVLARSGSSAKLKSHRPKYNFRNRTKALLRFEKNMQIVAGDKKNGAWGVLRTYNPEIIFLGYDQQELATALKKAKVKCIFLKPHNPKKYKSSLINYK